MSERTAPRGAVRARPEWWVVTAWCSLALLVVAGLLAAAGVG